MSRYISVDLESRVVVDIPTGDVVSRRSQFRSQQPEMLALLDRLEQTQKNRIMDSAIKHLGDSYAKIRARLLRYAKYLFWQLRNPQWEIDRVFNMSLQENSPIHRQQSIVVDINKKYDAPISQRLQQVREATNITQHKLHKQRLNERKHRSEDSPNTRRVNGIGIGVDALPPSQESGAASQQQHPPARQAPPRKLPADPIAARLIVKQLV